jgi:hypothetical protein
LASIILSVINERPNWDFHPYALYFGNAFLTALFFTRIRFRAPLDALLIILPLDSLSCRLALGGRRRRSRLPRSPGVEARGAEQLGCHSPRAPDFGV